LQKNWQAWFSKFCFWLNQRAFPMEDSRVNDFFLITDVNFGGQIPEVRRYHQTYSNLIDSSFVFATITGDLQSHPE
jgi:hypothetical protein